ncbi:MAG: hypothetical protein HXX13_02205 [Bacteroidetes bacterium]|nr:hypothetical protein [Bacteroidota bacterium]
MEGKSASTLGYKIIIGILILIIAVLVYLLMNQKKEVVTVTQEANTEKNEMQVQLDSLLAEHERVKASYGKLSDSLIEKDSIIKVKAIEIKKLLGVSSELNVAREKLMQLQMITKGYERQIDSLYTVNRKLRQENEKIRTDYNLEQQKTADLSKDKEQLNEKINGAAVLKAYKVTATTLKIRGENKERVTDKASRTDKIKVCFTIGENKLVSNGYQRFFVRIAKPDNTILTRGPAYTFQFLGQTLQFSAMETLNYEGEAADICTYYEQTAKASELPKGRYIVTIFTEDKQIGDATFELK